MSAVAAAAARAAADAATAAASAARDAAAAAHEAARQAEQADADANGLSSADMRGTGDKPSAQASSPKNWRDFVGAFHSGCKSGADNEAIDTDLAREYQSGFGEQ